MKKRNIILNLILFIFACIGILHLINRLIASRAEGKGQLSSLPGHFYNWKGDQIFYQVKGEGKPLLLLHDLKAAASGCEWDRVVNRLAANRRVYVLDLVGCGRSARPNITYVAFYYVQLIQAFLKDIITEKADVIGSNASAALAVSAAAYDSSLIDRIILVNPSDRQPLAFDSFFWNRFLPKVLRMPVLGTFAYNMIFTRTRIDADLTESVLYNPFNSTDELLDICWEGAHRGDSKGRYFYASQLSGCLDNDPSIAFKKAENEVFIILGEAFTDKETTGHLIDVKTDVKIREIKKSACLPHLEEPEAFINAVNEFLAEESPEVTEDEAV